jgi:uncharacterized cupredoxin-like copper-binding protein
MRDKIREWLKRVAVAGVALMLVVGGATAGASRSAAAGTKVKIVLSEFIVKAKPKRVVPGKVTFVVKNKGTEIHEFVVVKGDDPDTLAAAADGTVDEEQIAKTDQVGEIEDIKAGTTQKVTFKLKYGKYILFCNIFDEDEQESHFAEGMVTTFTVG